MDTTTVVSKSTRSAVPRNIGRATAVGIATLLAALVLLMIIAAFLLQYVPAERLERFTIVILMMWAGAYAAAGYVAGRITKEKPVMTGLIVGAIIAIFGLIIQSIVVRQTDVASDIVAAGGSLATSPGNRIVSALIASALEIAVITAGSWIAFITKRPPR